MAMMSVWPTDGEDGSVATEARWRKMGRLWAPSGVADNAGGEMAPSLAGTNLTVRSGACWVDGHYAELDSDQVLTVTANGLAVVRFDPAANSAELLYRDGATTPTQNREGIWEQPIARITAGALTDQRGPLINPAQERADIDAISPVVTRLTADSGWLTIPLVTGFTGSLLSRRIGAFVTVVISITRTGANLGNVTSTLGTVTAPADRPSATIPGVVYVTNPAASARLNVGANGAVSLLGYSVNDTGIIQGHATYPVALP